MTILHSRPFDSRKAALGAPYATREGFSILSHDWDSNGRILGVVLTDNIRFRNGYRHAWNKQGQYLGLAGAAYANKPENPDGPHQDDLVMVPCAYLRGQPVFPGDSLLKGRGVGTVVKVRMTDTFSDIQFYRFPGENLHAQTAMPEIKLSTTELGKMMGVDVLSRGEAVQMEKILKLINTVMSSFLQTKPTEVLDYYEERGLIE